jgi:hypothetical protein
MSQSRIEQLERDIADLKARLPKHSVKPVMIQQLEEMEAAPERELLKTEEE